jgi:hypothetical protein
MVGHAAGGRIPGEHLQQARDRGDRQADLE